VKRTLPDQLYRKIDGYVTRCITGETIIVPIRSGVGDLDAIFTLNEVGTRVWKLIDRGLSLHRIVELVEKEYEVSPEEAREDVERFLESLQQAGLVHTVP